MDLVADQRDAAAARDEDAGAGPATDGDVEHLDAVAVHRHLGGGGRFEPLRAGADQRDADQRGVAAGDLHRLRVRAGGGERGAVAGHHHLLATDGQHVAHPVVARRQHQPLARLQAIQRRLQGSGLVGPAGYRLDRHIGCGADRVDRAAHLLAAAQPQHERRQRQGRQYAGRSALALAPRHVARPAAASGETFNSFAMVPMALVLRPFLRPDRWFAVAS
ncbi:hypothetical protein D3C81_1598650 [compost metagenome]